MARPQNQFPRLDPEWFAMDVPCGKLWRRRLRVEAPVCRTYGCAMACGHCGGGEMLGPEWFAANFALACPNANAKGQQGQQEATAHAGRLVLRLERRIGIPSVVLPLWSPVLLRMCFSSVLRRCVVSGSGPAECTKHLAKNVSIGMVPVFLVALVPSGVEMSVKGLSSTGSARHSLVTL